MLPIIQSHPRFIVFPAPQGLTSVNLAHSSSFLLLSSDLASPNAVPSCSASIASCSEDTKLVAPTFWCQRIEPSSALLRWRLDFMPSPALGWGVLRLW